MRDRVTLLSIILILAACGGEDRPEPIELSALIGEEAPSPSAQEVPLCAPPVLELRLDDWQTVLDLPLGDEDVPNRPTPRRLLRKWVPGSLVEPGPTAARVRVEGLTVGVDSAGSPGIRGLDAVATLTMEAGPARTALQADLEDWIRTLCAPIPGTPQITAEPGDGTLVLRIRLGSPQTPEQRPACRPGTDGIPAGSGIRLRVGIPALLDVLERAAGPLLLWSVLPEELGLWRTLDLEIRAGGADRIALRLDTGAGALTGLIAEMKAPTRPGWDRFLPPTTPVTVAFSLHEAAAWTRHLSDLMFEKGFKVKGIDPVKLLDDDWETQLGELLSGPAVGFPITGKVDLGRWDEGWIFYLQPKDVTELKGRLRRVFDLKKYVTRPETFRKRDLMVVRFRRAGKNKVGGVRFAWYCEDTGCWLSRTMGGFDRLFDVEAGSTSAQTRQVRSLLDGDVLAFAVANPRTFGEQFQLPEPKKKKKPGKKKGGLSLPSFGDSEAIARAVVENAVRGALTELPEDLLLTAALRADGDALELEVTGLFRFLGRVATKFLPLL